MDHDSNYNERLSAQCASLRRFHLLNEENPLNKQNVFYKPCQFYLRYRRSDPYDEQSRYVLTEYDMTHSHPLDIRISTPIYLKQ
mmetsp:Transcript_7496/g.12662  ORF Transcript_7496/g.12662 Transcript_7496/m.12662 type:complete len:84 (+) Transcript_7496:2057-2308(+)